MFGLQVRKQNQVMDQLRHTALSQAELMSSRRRFDLFSQPPPLSIGDNSLYPSKTARKGEDGKPISLPRNMLPGPNKSGMSRRDFIDPPSSINAGDKYLDPEKIDHLYNKKFHTRAGFHEREFKPSSGSKILFSSSYKHIDENPKQKMKPKRDETGRVVTSDRNALTNPLTRVQSDLFKHPKYIVDPYERKDMFQQKERKLDHEKRGDQLFRSMSHGNILFTNHKEIYGEDSVAKELLEKKKIFSNTPPRAVNHEAKFKLARKGHGDPIGKYPEFVPPAETKSQISRARKNKSDKDDWKHVGNRSQSRPTPSISYSSFSLRKYM